MIRVNSETAELVGIMLGDGNMNRTGDSYEMRVILNKKEIAYAERICGIIGRVLGYSPKISFRKVKNVIDVKLQRKNAVNSMFILGLDYGNRIKKQTPVPRWIFSREDFMRACLRGLIDTDGTCYFLKPHWPNLRQIAFKSNNPRLLMDTRKLFLKLGFSPSNIFGNRIVLTRQAEIVRYFKEVGTSNDKYSPVV